MELLFTKAIFWDTDISKLDASLHSKYIIEKVLNYGTLEDWKKLKQLYSEERILAEAKKIRDLHPKTLSFLSIYYNVSKTEFHCYTEIPSTRTHFPY